MGLSELFDFLEKTTLLSKHENVFEFAKVKKSSNNKFHVLIDSCECSSRLYGGFNNDWLCGGQWKTMYNFLNNLVVACDRNSVLLTFILNSEIYEDRGVEWTHVEYQRQHDCEVVISTMEDQCIFPTNGNWVAPSGFSACLCKMLIALSAQNKSCNLVMTQSNTLDEVIALSYDKAYDAFLTRSSEFLIMQPPNMFDASSLLLTRNLSAFCAKEVDYKQLVTLLNVEQKNLPLFATLLGTRQFLGNHLATFHQQLLGNDEKVKNKVGKARLKKLIPAIADFINKLTESDLNDPSKLAKLVLGADSETDKQDMFIKCVDYYKTLANMKKSHDSSSEIESTENSDESSPKKHLENVLSLRKLSCPEIVSSQIWEIVKLRHSKGLMMPQIMSLLKFRTIWLKITGLDNPRNDEIPCGSKLFRPLRQKMYSILFDSHVPDQSSVKIKEWCSGKTVDPAVCDLVEPTPLIWIVPRLEELWTMQSPEADGLRLRAFLSCFNSDLVIFRKIPPKNLLLCCILRYMVSSDTAFMTSTEIDAFIIQTLELETWSADQLSAITVERLSSRALELASVFMQGYHNALIVNDACGAPIPARFTSIWDIFDGKLFQLILSFAHYGNTRQEMCKNKPELLQQVSYLSSAIMQGFTGQHLLQYRATFAHYASVLEVPRPVSRGDNSKYQSQRGSFGRGTGGGYRHNVMGNSGRMDIAGVTVGFWQANARGYGYDGPPQVFNVGYPSRQPDLNNPFAKPDMPPPRMSSGDPRGFNRNRRRGNAARQNSKFTKNSSNNTPNVENPPSLVK